MITNSCKLRNPSVEGEELIIGQEPEIADGVIGTWFDTPDGIWIPIVAAKNPGNGDVAKMLNDLPTNRKIVFPTVISSILRSMLLRRGFEETVVGHDSELGDIFGMQRLPK